MSSHQHRHHPYRQRHHRHHNDNANDNNTSTTTKVIDVITLDADHNDNNDNNIDCTNVRPTTSKGASSSFSHTTIGHTRSPTATATAAAKNVDHDYCVLIAEYSRDELERTRRHEQQQHERQQREQQQQLANAHVMTTRVMTAFSALEERYEACATELAESREESEGWRDDLGRFGRRQYEERRAADQQHTANAALIATLNRELDDARHTIAQHNNNNNNNVNNNGHMMCPVCHESYVDLQATGN
jgi:hypothetical protein